MSFSTFGAMGQPVFAALVAASVKGTILLLAAWLLTRALRQAAASIRHLIWTTALAGVLIIPIASLVTPRIAIHLPRAASPVSTTVVRDVVATSTQRAEPAVPAEPARPVSPSVSRPSLPSTSEMLAMLPALWLTIALVILLRLVLGNARLSLWTRRASPVVDGEWLSLARRLASRLKIERPISLLGSARAHIPMTWGVIYPVVLLPNDADEWPEERRIAVLLHELAHVQRFDALTQLIAQLAIAVFWFNPLVWVAARRMRVEREHACDDVVLACGARASNYASDLLQIARRLAGNSQVTAAAALAMARRGEFEGRLLAILDPHARRHGVSRTRAIFASVSVLVLALPLAALTPAPQASSPPQQRLADSARADAPPPAQAPARATTRQPAPRLRVESPPSFSLPSMPEVNIGGVVTAVKSIISTPSLRASSLSLGLTAPDRETMVAVLKQAAKMTSSYDKAELLLAVVKHYTPDDEVRTAYLDAVMSMSSSYDQARTLMPLLLKDELPPAAIGQVVKVASHMSSDNDKARVFVRVLSERPSLSAGVTDAIIAGASTITSSYDRARTLVAITTVAELSNQQVVALLGSAKGLSSSNDKATVLVTVAGRFALTDKTVRGAFLDAAESISSSADYRRVMTSFLR